MASRSTNLPFASVIAPPTTNNEEEQIVDFGNYARVLAVNENILDVELLRPLCLHFDALTSNWYLQDIGAPYALSVCICLHYDAIFGRGAWVDPDTAKLLLQTWQKALNRKPKFRDSLSNGLGACLPYAIYIQMMDRGKVPFLQSVEERRIEVGCLLATDIQILPLSKFPADGLYVDGSSVYHGTGNSASLSYNLSMLAFMADMKLCGVRGISTQKWEACLQSVAQLIYGSYSQPMAFGRGASRQISPRSLIEVLTKTKGWFGQGDIYDALQYARHTTSDQRCVIRLSNIFSPYIVAYRNAQGRITRKIEGMYTWYGSGTGDYDGYNITSSPAALETTINASWANDLAINTNLRTLLSYTDEPLTQWIQQRNDQRLPLYLGGLVMSGQANTWLLYNDAYPYRSQLGITSLSACIPSAHPYVDVVYTWQQMNTGQPLNAIETISIVDRRARGITHFVVPVLDASKEGDGTQIRLSLHGTLENNAIISADHKSKTASLRSSLIRNRFVQVMIGENADVFAFNVGYPQTASTTPSTLCSNINYDPPIPYTPADPANEPGNLGAPPADPPTASAPPPNGTQLNSLVGLQMNKTKQVYAVFTSSVSLFQPPESVSVCNFIDPSNWFAQYSNKNITVEIERFDAGSKRFQIGGASPENSRRLLRVAVSGDGKSTNTVIDGSLDPYASPVNVCNAERCVTANQSFAFYRLESN